MEDQKRMDQRELHDVLCAIIDKALFKNERNCSILKIRIWISQQEFVGRTIRILYQVKCIKKLPLKGRISKNLMSGKIDSKVISTYLENIKKLYFLDGIVKNIRKKFKKEISKISISYPDSSTRYLDINIDNRTGSKENVIAIYKTMDALEIKIELEE